MIDDPLSLVAAGVWLLAVGMYPVGFLFGVCSECCTHCSNETCDGFDLNAAYEKEDLGGGALKSGRCLHTVQGAGVFGVNATGCTGFSDPDLSENCSAGVPSVPQGCEGEGVWVRRRSCVRWVCRCYESTGERALDNQTVSEWYTVVSTTVVGGPTTNNLDLSQELDDAQVTCPTPGISLQDYFISGGSLGDFTNGPQGTKGCIIWAFVFYGWVIDCEEPHTGISDQHESRDDCYTIHPCVRCL